MRKFFIVMLAVMIAAVCSCAYAVEEDALTILPDYIYLTGGVVSQDYSYQLSISEDVSNVTWSIVAGELPDGLELDALTGIIRGVPTEENLQKYTFTFTVRAETDTRAGEKEYTIEVSETSGDNGIKIKVEADTGGCSVGVGSLSMILLACVSFRKSKG